MKEQNYVILTDSTTDISQAIADEINVKVWPMQFELDGLAYRNFPDEREMKSDDFYDLLFLPYQFTVLIIFVIAAA